MGRGDGGGEGVKKKYKKEKALADQYAGVFRTHSWKEYVQKLKRKVSFRGRPPRPRN
jgi:hypothetical protein